MVFVFVVNNCTIVDLIVDMQDRRLEVVVANTPSIYLLTEQATDQVLKAIQDLIAEDAVMEIGVPFAFGFISVRRLRGKSFNLSCTVCFGGRQSTRQVRVCPDFKALFPDYTVNCVQDLPRWLQDGQVNIAERLRRGYYTPDMISVYALYNARLIAHADDSTDADADERRRA